MASSGPSRPVPRPEVRPEEWEELLKRLQKELDESTQAAATLRRERDLWRGQAEEFQGAVDEWMRAFERAEASRRTAEEARVRAEHARDEETVHHLRADMMGATSGITAVQVAELGKLRDVAARVCDTLRVPLAGSVGSAERLAEVASWVGGLEMAAFRQGASMALGAARSHCAELNLEAIHGGFAPGLSAEESREIVESAEAAGAALAINLAPRCLPLRNLGHLSR
ncbi:hypothetical protein ACP70R_018828 [Stipagrostis hirtigluma subsp. patula]